MSKHSQSVCPVVGDKRARVEATIIDELGQIEKELSAAFDAAAVEAAKLQPKYARAAVLRAILLAACGKEPATDEVVLPGKLFDAVASKQEIRRTMTTIARVCKVLGVKRFLKAADVTLAALKKVATAEEYSALVTEARTGPRTLKVIARAQQEKKAA